MLIRHRPSAVSFVRQANQIPSISTLRKRLVTIMASLSERFAAVMETKEQESFDKMSFDQMAQMKISFEEAKLNQRFLDVVEQDPKYVKWFTKKYGESQKPSHRSFLRFINLDVERRELEQGKESHPKPSSSTMGLKPKAKCSPSLAPETESLGSWSEEDLPPAWRSPIPAHHQHGELPEPDHAPNSGTCPNDSDPGEPMSTGQNAHEFQSWMYDDLGIQHFKRNPDDVLDPAYFTDALSEQNTCRSNWVVDEMWQYFQKSHPHMTQDDTQRHWSINKIDLLEVYCSEDSQMTKQGLNLGMSCVRFGLRHGDLSTFQGRCRLYDLLWITRPRHIWTAPRCGPWSNWNCLNATKSPELAEKILKDRRSENVHLLLCDALLFLQVWRGSSYHFHLEQPQGSEMIYQKEMTNIVTFTLKVVYDMCVAGRLQHPESHEALRKRTQVLKTSPIVWRTLERCQCVGTHHHDPIAGSCRPPGQSRMPLTKYTELYTATFGRRICRAIQCSIQIQESTLGYREESAFVSRTSKPVVKEPVAKRRRVNGKQLVPEPNVPDARSPRESCDVLCVAVWIATAL